MDLVTESFTLMAGNSSSPRSNIWYSRWTPVVVSSVTPLMPAAMRVHFDGIGLERALQQAEHDGELGVRGAGRVGHLTGLLELDPLVDQQRGVAAVVEDHVRSVAAGASQLSACSVHHQYSSSVSPFQANTGTPCGSSAVPSGPTTTAAAA